MKSHRKHAPNLPSERVYTSLKGRLSGRLSPDGVKRRLDKLNASIRTFWFWFEIHEQGKASAANCTYKSQGHRTRWGVCWHGDQESWSLKRAKKEMDALWNAARKDGIL